MIANIVKRFKENKYTAEFCNEQTLKQLVRYLVVGFSSFFTEMTLFLVLKQLIGYIWANRIALTIVFWLNFLLNRLWSFQSKLKVWRQVVQYGALFAINITVSDLMLRWLHGMLGINAVISKVIAVALVVSWNFIIYKKVIYK